jgi:biotin carboxyl carrier protein
MDNVKVSFRGYSFSGRALQEHHHTLLTVLHASPAMRSRTIRIATPMPGLLKSVLTSDGSEVRKGQALFTLEAMKMENSITAPIHGIVRDVCTSEGQALDKGFRLCTIEPLLQ